MGRKGNAHMLILYYNFTVVSAIECSNWGQFRETGEFQENILFKEIIFKKHFHSYYIIEYFFPKVEI